MSINGPPPRRLVVGDPSGPATYTNIDRRGLKRQVPMKVLALGLSRTGTSSIRQALIDLGYDDCYHLGSIITENPPDAQLWIEAIEAKFEGKGELFTKADWDQLLGHCMAVADTPCVWFYKELLEAYPEAKVVLTVRDSPEQWWQSHMSTIVPFFDKFAAPPATWSNWLYRQFMPPPDILSKMYYLFPNHYEMYIILVDDYRNGTKNGIKWFENYCEEIQQIIPKENLLVFNQREGWKPLCQFLGKEIPGWDYPLANNRHDFKENTSHIHAYLDHQVYLRAAKTAGAVAVAALAVGIALSWRRSLRLGM